LNVQEEERIKGSLVTPTKITEHLNRCIFDTLVEKPDKIKTFNDFLETVTTKDRDALLYGLYHITYDEIRNYDVKCGTCKKEYSVTIEASSTFNINVYPGDDILKKKARFELPITKGVFVSVKQPSLKDELHALKTFSNRAGVTVEVLTETLIIDCFEQDNAEANPPDLYDDRLDIIDAYLSLPARDKIMIFNKYMEEFGNYGIDLKMKSFCTNCGADEIIIIDLLEQFFRMVFSN